MIDHVVVDVEIQKCVEETPGGWDATDLLGVACACLWEYATGRMRVYGPDDVPALRERLLRADRISGYNIWRFDFPVIWGVAKPLWSGPGTVENLRLGSRLLEAYRALQPKTDDLLRRIWQAQGLDPDVFDKRTHGGWGLDAVAKATLNGPGKIGNGADAPRWFQAGQWARVCNYCADDVALERDLCDFIDRYGYVNNGFLNQIKVAPWNGGA